MKDGEYMNMVCVCVCVCRYFERQYQLDGDAHRSSHCTVTSISIPVHRSSLDPVLDRVKFCSIKNWSWERPGKEARLVQAQ